MPSLKNYHILISHSWNYSQYYEKVSTWLNETPYFLWSNYSVCCDNPLDTKTDSELKQRLTNKISNCSVVIVLSGMYSAYSKWIDYEINEAIRFGKPIIGIRPWGAERVPLKIQANATVMVNWQSSSVIDAIRKYAL